MRTVPPADDAAAERLLRGGPVAPEFQPLAGFVHDVRAVRNQPARPSDDLSRRMAAGDFTGVEPERSPTARTGRRSGIGSVPMGARTRVITGVAVLLTAFTGVAAAGALPDGAQRRVDSFVESINPFTGSGQGPAGDIADDSGQDTAPGRLGPADEQSRSQSDGHRSERPAADAGPYGPRRLGSLEKPDHAADGKPGHAADGKPDHAADGKPGHAADGKPGHAADGKPGHAADGKPDHAADGESGGSSSGNSNDSRGRSDDVRSDHPGGKPGKSPAVPGG